MLFLFNDAIFDLGDPKEVVLSSDLPLDAAALKRLRVGQVARLIREAVFEEPWIQRTRPDRARVLAALVAWKTGEANALLAVTAEGAGSALDVQLRFANLSLVTMEQLRELQASERLTATIVNQTVWMQAPARMSA
ncbi:MAG: hypothetical protein AAFX09_00045 [Pseudomonadota bacterium]